jgi:hypothetical protein
MHFRYAFRELAAGKHPDSPGWVVTKQGDRSFGEGLGPIPRELSADEQRELSQVISEASLTEIRKVAQFPDWLGYLGLGLRYCEGDEFQSGRLTQNLVPQFLEFLEPTSDAARRLTEIRDHSPQMLCWFHLEIVEGALKSSSRDLI